MELQQDTRSMAPSVGSRHNVLRAGLIIAAIVVLLVVANAHLVYVAVSSQPECVPHQKSLDGEAGTFRAAKPSC